MEDKLLAFRFLTIQCRSCGCDFIISPTEQEWFLKTRLSIPSHCPVCRQERKLAKQQATQGQGGERDGS
jgi:hypothetical protein